MIHKCMIHFVQYHDSFGDGKTFSSDPRDIRRACTHSSSGPTTPVEVVETMDPSHSTDQYKEDLFFYKARRGSRLTVRHHRTWHGKRLIIASP
mmetsp:Transcript_52816/g.128045  ORF Transcript_52816/g.128045 Transcript_52816/m.128045 type:complete len:93 (+) Transcript_52816:256-534(+)